MKDGLERKFLSHLFVIWVQMVSVVGMRWGWDWQLQYVRDGHPDGVAMPCTFRFMCAASFEE